MPLQCEFFALEGVSQLVRTIEAIRRNLNPRLALQGIVLTMFDRRNNLSEAVAADARSVFGDRVYDTVVPRNVRVSEAPSHGKPVLLYDWRSPGAQAYVKLAAEVLRRERREAHARSGRGTPAPPRLGRGLAALLGDTQAAPGAGGGTLPVSALEPGPFQPRAAMDPDALASLTSTSAARACCSRCSRGPTPSVPAPTRSLAASAAGRGPGRRAAQFPSSSASCPTWTPWRPPSSRTCSAMTSIPSRKPRATAELADEFGLTQERLSDAVGKTRSHVANTLRLLHLPAPVRDHVVSGALSAGHARALLSHADPESIAQQVIKRGLTVRQTEALSTRPPRAQGTPREPRAIRPEDPGTDALARSVSECLGLRVEITWDGRGGSDRVHYQSLDQLETACDRLTQNRERGIRG